MAFEHDITPLQVSYLDLYAFAGKNGYIRKVTIDNVVDYHVDELFALPILDKSIIDNTLWEMGMDTRYSVEEVKCFHRPNCMATARVEDTAKIFGLCYQGQQRTDKEWEKKLQQLQQQ